MFRVYSVQSEQKKTVLLRIILQQRGHDDWGKVIGKVRTGQGLPHGDRVVVKKFVAVAVRVWNSA